MNGIELTYNGQVVASYKSDSVTCADLVNEAIQRALMHLPLPKPNGYRALNTQGQLVKSGSIP